MKRDTNSSEATMVIKTGHILRNPLAIFRAIENWQIARYSATAIQPERIESKGSDPTINTKTEKSPRTNASMIFPMGNYLHIWKSLCWHSFAITTDEFIFIIFSPDDSISNWYISWYSHESCSGKLL
jgi:hypothetical protein